MMSLRARFFSKLFQVWEKLENRHVSRNENEDEVADTLSFSSSLTIENIILANI